jgi:hypothetical protein
MAWVWRAAVELLPGLDVAVDRDVREFLRNRFDRGARLRHRHALGGVHGELLRAVAVGEERGKRLRRDDHTPERHAPHVDDERDMERPPVHGQLVADG